MVVWMMHLISEDGLQEKTVEVKATDRMAAYRKIAHGDDDTWKVIFAEPMEKEA